jgi:hypothetical protein
MQRFHHAYLQAAIVIATAVYLSVASVAESAISRVAPGHIGGAFSSQALSPNAHFPLQTGLNKLTLQGNAAMLTATMISLERLKANATIVGRGPNYLHVNITVSHKAPQGQTGRATVEQRLRIGQPDQFNWRVFTRGHVAAIDGPSSVALNSEHIITFRGSGLERAELRPHHNEWTIVRRLRRSAHSVHYRIRFNRCSSGETYFTQYMLVNESLPPTFKRDVQLSHFRGQVRKPVTIIASGCGRPRVRAGAISKGCLPGYYKPYPNSQCIKR